MAVVTEIEGGDTPERVASRVFPPPKPPSNPPSPLSQPLKKRGRPVNPDKIDVPHLPKPVSYRPKPKVFFDYWRGIEGKYPNRVTVYVYRRWPIINRDLVGKSRNIDKVSAPFPEDFENEILHRYGSGDYRLDLTDSAFNKKVCECSISGLRDPDYPPAIELEEVVMDDPANRSYVENLRLKGQLGPLNKDKGEEMEQGALTAVLQANTALTDRVLDMADERAEKRDTANPEPRDINADAAARSMDIIDRAAGMGERIIDRATTKAAEISGKQQDPLAIVETILKVVQTNQPRSDTPDPFLVSVLEESKQLRAQLFEMQSRMVDGLRQELAAARMVQTNPQLQPPPGIAGVHQTFQPEMLDGVDKLLTLFTKLKRGFGMEEGEGMEHVRPEPENMWTKILPIAIPAFTGIMAMVSNMMYNYAASKTNQQPQAPPPVQQAMTPEQLAQLASGQMQPGDQFGGGQEPGQDQSQGNGGSGQDMGNPYQKMLAELKDPLLRALNNPVVDENSHPGAEFADLLIGWKGRMAYDALRELGGDMIVQLLRTYPPIWNEIIKVPKRFQVFLGEFLNYDKLMAEQEREQEEGEGEGEEGEGQGREYQPPPPPPPTPAPAATRVRRVKTIRVESEPAKVATPETSVETPPTS